MATDTTTHSSSSQSSGSARYLRCTKVPSLLFSNSRDACFNAPIPNYITHQWDPAAPIEKIPHLFFTDPIEGTDYYGKPIPPEFIVDISSTFELKRQMLACHESQRSWLRKQHGIDEYLDRTERWSTARGTEINAQYGEAFTQYKGHPYPADNLLLELLQP